MADDTASMTFTAIQQASLALRDKSGRDKFGHARAAERRTRLAAELRVNLQRRKAKQRAEAAAEPPPTDT